MRAERFAPVGVATDVAELDLLDWRRQVAELYRSVREDADRRAAWERWREARGALIREHPQSPVPAERRDSFAGLRYYDYRPDLAMLAALVPARSSSVAIGSSTGGPIR